MFGVFLAINGSFIGSSETRGRMTVAYSLPFSLSLFQAAGARFAAPTPGFQEFATNHGSRILGARKGKADLSNSTTP